MTRSLSASSNIIGQGGFLLVSRPFAARLGVCANQMYGKLNFLFGGMYASYSMIYMTATAAWLVNFQRENRWPALRPRFAVQPATWQSTRLRALRQRAVVSWRSRGS
jgi:hypothetical protein